MAGLQDVRAAAEQIVGPVCGNKSRSCAESEVARMLHAYLAGRYAAVYREHKVPIRKKVRAIDFRFGDRPHGANPCLFELAVRNSENGSQLLCSQNKRELEKLARYPLTRANTRVLLLLDLGHDPIKQSSLQPGYDAHSLNVGNQI